MKTPAALCSSSSREQPERSFFGLSRHSHAEERSSAARIDRRHSNDAGRTLIAGLHAADPPAPNSMVLGMLAQGCSSGSKPQTNRPCGL